MLAVSHMIHEKNIPDCKIREMFVIDTDSLPLSIPLANTLHYINKFSEKERFKKKNKNIDWIKESIKNKQILEKITNKKIFSMSHPSGSYNSNTLKILEKLKIKIGFKDNLLYKKKINISKFELAREDVSLILNK